MQSSLFRSHRFHRSHVKIISKNIFSFLTMIYDLCIKFFYVSLTIKICTNNFFHWPVVRIHPWLVLISLVLCQNCETLFLFQYFSVQRKCEWQELVDSGWNRKDSDFFHCRHISCWWAGEFQFNDLGALTSPQRMLLLQLINPNLICFYHNPLPI